ncbi:hypothetical protein K8R14_03900 [bacterium]|nr:hypothetical protein [bacterium]
MPTPELFSTKEYTTPKAPPPSRRPPRNPDNPYPCEDPNKEVENNGDHLKPKQMLSLLMNDLISQIGSLREFNQDFEQQWQNPRFNPTHFLEDILTQNYYTSPYAQSFLNNPTEQEGWNILGHPNFNPTKFPKPDKAELQPPLFPILRFLQIENLKPYIDNNIEEYLTSFLLWYFEQNDEMQNNVFLKGKLIDNEEIKLTSGFCDALEYSKKTATLYEFKLGDPNDYPRHQQSLHYKQVIKYLELFKTNYPYIENISGQLIYFTSNPYQRLIITTLDDTSY